MVVPIGLPVSVGHYTETCYNLVETLKPGDKIMVDIGYSVSGAADVEPQLVAIMKQVMNKDVRVIFTAIQADGPMQLEAILAPWEKAGKVYGKDFVNLGYLAGAENAISMYCKDVKKAYPLDFRGNPTDNMPILDGITGADDIVMFLAFSTSNADSYVRQVGPYNKPIIAGLAKSLSSQAEPYVHSGQLAGMLAGLRAAAEYEQLMKSPGTGMASMDAQSMGHLLIIVFVILGNCSYFLTRSKKATGREAAK